MKMIFLRLVKLVVCLVLVTAVSSTAFGEEFYKGKIIRFMVGYSPGGGYDTYTRTIARHIGKHIPGSPTPIVQNRTGAGSLIAANYLYKRTKPDGLTVGVWNSTYVLHQAVGSRRIRFDARKFGWIGAPVTGLPACSVMGFTGLKTFEDILNSKKPIKMGASSGTGLEMPKIINMALGRTVFNVIPGYKGTSIILLAMRAKELDGLCQGYESTRVVARAMLDAKGDEKLIPFMIHGHAEDPEVKDITQLRDVIKGKKSQAMLNAWLQQYNFQRPLSLPPGTPKERITTLRRAFKATLEDPAFLADAKKSKLQIEYVSGRNIEKFVDQILLISAKTKESLQWVAPK
jgi:tripartite-type tricarboxylate transporter receptor subunit TctC